jgi:signal transduction histidine kinase
MESSVARRIGRVERDVQAIGALTQAVLDGDDLEQLLGRIAREARVLADAISGVVVTVARDTGLMTFRAVDGLTAGPLRLGHVMPVAGTLTELALKRGRNVVVHRMEEMPPAGQAFAAAIGVGPLVAAPLALIGPAHGVLLAARSDTSPPFSRADVSLISTFAAQAASAIELVDLRTAESALATTAERARIAGDLHDGVIRALRDLQAGLRELLPAADAELAGGVRNVVLQLDEAIATIGAAVVELRSAPADDAGTPATGAIAAGPRPATLPTARSSAGGRGSAATIAVMGDLARAAARDPGTAAVLDTLVREVVGRSSAHLALIGTLTDDGASILVRSRAGIDVPGRNVGDLVPVGETIVGQAIREGRAFVPSSAAAIAARVPAEVARLVGPVVAVPLQIRGQRFGAMTIARTPGSPAFSRSEVALIEAYGVQAAIALEFERVRGELRRGSVSLERERIGRDLHQRVVQLLFGVAFALQALESTVRDTAVRTSLQATVEGLDRVIRDLRRLVFGLAPGPGADEKVDEKVRTLAADNARLQEEITAQLAEVRASRVRIIAAGDAERKRVERDLHDGAQQRLVSLTLALRLARSRLGEDLDPSAALSLDQASSDAKAALSELRELARGIHPQILTEAGLGPAVESLAARSSVDIRVEIGAARFSSAVEGAAYFTISEALANVAKYAQANQAIVRAGRLDDVLLVEVADDGIGGADPATGTGLRGLADRLESVNGSLQIRSPLGEGTQLVARIPVPAVGA